MLDQEPQSRRPAWSLILDLGVFAIFFLVTVLAFSLATLKLVPDLQNSVGTAVVIQGLMNAVIVAFIVFLVTIVHHRSFKETIRWNSDQPFNTGWLVCFGVGLALTVTVMSKFFPETSQTPIEKLLSSAKSLYLFALFGILVAPICEEIIFRGFLFNVFEELTSAKAAIPATAGLFAMLHAFQLYGNWGAVFLIFAVGCVLAGIRQRSGSLIPGLIVHTAYNSTLFGMYAIGSLVQGGIKP